MLLRQYAAFVTFGLWVPHGDTAVFTKNSTLALLKERLDAVRILPQTSFMHSTYLVMTAGASAIVPGLPSGSQLPTARLCP